MSIYKDYFKSKFGCIYVYLILYVDIDAWHINTEIPAMTLLFLE